MQTFADSQIQLDTPNNSSNYNVNGSFGVVLFLVCTIQIVWNMMCARYNNVK